MFYRETDFVLLPIISGGGMKTKTADALMWVKAIIGTPEVFFGYEVSELHGIYECKTEDDFICAIKNIYEDEIYDFNEAIHQRFVKRHSVEAVTSSVKDFFFRREEN